MKHSRLLLSVCTALLAGSAASGAWAFDPDIAAIEDMRVVERFPSGSIVSREKADRAMTEVSAAKTRMKELADYSTRRCQENFFVNDCVDKVRKARLRQERRFLAIETEARQVIRRDETRKEAERQKKRDEKSLAAPKPPKTLKEPRKPTATEADAAKNRAARVQRRQEVLERQKAAEKKAAKADENRAALEEKIRIRDAKRLEREKKLEERRRKNEERARAAQEESQKK